MVADSGDYIGGYLTTEFISEWHRDIALDTQELSGWFQMNLEVDNRVQFSYEIIQGHLSKLMESQFMKLPKLPLSRRILLS